MIRKKRALLRGLLAGALIFSGLSYAQEVAEPNEKAKRYHSLLLKKPGNATVFNRFVNTWLDTGTKKELKAWLEQSAKEGGAAEWRVLAALHEYLGEDEEALRALNEAVKQDENDASLRLARAKLQAKLLSFEAALKDLEAVTNDEKLGVKASKLQGVYLARAGRVDEAVTVWKEVIARFPEDENLREDLIEVELVEGLYDDAIKASRELVELTKDPYKKALRQLRLGEIQILANQKKDGLATYEDIMAATGADTWLEREVLAQIERVFQREDDIRGLRDFFQKLRETYPRRVSVRKALARQMALNGEMDEAIALFREVIQITPGDLGNREGFISFLETNERWKEARAEVNNLLTQRNQDPLLWERLAGLEEKLKNTEGLKAALARVLELKKDSPSGLIAVATLYTQSGLPAEAEALLREGRETFPDSGEVSESLASFLIQNEKEEEALALWTAMAETADRQGLLRVVRSLTGHGKGETAFQLLQTRLSEFGEDPLVLTPFCNLAASVEEAAAAIPFALELVAQSSSPTDLESAIKTAARVIKRAEKQNEILGELGAKEEPAIPFRCLMAELYAAQMDTLKALQVLDEAEKADPGLLARFYRVRFDENRGELESAIESLREIIALPEGRKTVHLRRLVGLQERLGDVEGALESVAEWKRMAPGDQSAWKRRAEVLASLGEPDQAVLELRRMVGKFGAEEESRALLAAALLEANEHRSAQRIYEQLYEEGEDLTSKLKWVAELAKVARKEGTLDDLLTDFERRKRENSQSLSPLLALAEIYQSLNQHEDRRNALLEASRRRPNDVKLLQHIADVEMRAGEFDRAVELLKDAAKRDHTSDSKQKLAELHLKNGEFRVGLRLLADIPGETNDPRRIEATAISLLRKTEWNLASTYLADLVPQHQGDWRLRYLQALALKEDGQDDQAFQIYRGLLEVDDEIKGVKPIYNPRPSQARYGRQLSKNGATMRGWSLLMYLKNVLANGQRNLGYLRQGSSFSNNRQIFALPGTPEEARMMSFIKASEIVEEFEEDRREEALASLSIAGVERVDLLRLFMTDRKKFFSRIDELLREDPDNPKYLQLWISNHSHANEGQTKDLARLRDIMGKAAKFDPNLALGLVSTMTSRELIGNAEAVEIYLNLLEKTPIGDPRETLLNRLSNLTLRQLMKDPEDQFERLAKVLVAEAVASEKKTGNPYWVKNCLGIALNQGFAEEGLVLLNRISQRLQDEGKASSLTNNRYFRGGYSNYSQSSSATLRVPDFPPREARGLPAVVAAEIARKLRTKQQGGSALSKRQAELLKLLKPKPEKESLEATPPEPLETLRGRTEEIEFPILRVLVESALGDPDALPGFAKTALTSNHRDELNLAAGYLWKENKQIETYQILSRMRMLTLSREERRDVDGMLAMVGAKLADQKDLEWDSEPAKRAALRLRKQLTGPFDRPALTAVMVKLGLQKEAEKLNTSPQQNRAFPARSSSRNSSRGITSLVADGRREEAVRVAAKLLRAYASSQNSRYEEERLMKSLANLGLTGAVLKKLDPGDSRSVSRRLTYANLALASDQLDLARPVFESILEDKPKLMAARIGLFMSLPGKERTYQSLLGKKDEKFDSDTVLQVMSKLWEKADNQFDETILILDFTANILETLTPSAEKERNLSWVNYHLARATTNNYYHGVSVRSLFGDAGSSNFDAERTAKFEKSVRRVSEAMLKHPQTAEQGFMILHKARKNLALKDEDLVTLARNGLQQLLLRQTTDQQRNHSSGLWILYSENGSSSSSTITGSPGPMDYLLANGHSEALLGDEFLALLQKNHPERFKSLTLARKLIAATSEKGLASFTNWYAGIQKNQKDEDRSRSQVFADLVQLTEHLLLLNPEPSPLTGELENRLTEFPGEDNGVQERWNAIAVPWLQWVTLHKGQEGARDFILKFCEGQLGPREKWPLMAELGYNFLPSHLQRPAYLLSQNLGKFCENDKAFRPILELSIHHDFSKIMNFSVINFMSNQLRNQQDPEKFAAWVGRTGLFHSPGNGERDPAVTLGLLGIIPSLPYNGSEHGEKMMTKIKSLKIDPLFKSLMLLRYKNDNQAKILAELWEPRVDLLQRLLETNDALARAQIKNWFPNYQSEKAGPKLTEFLKSLSIGQLVEARKKAERWLADGVQIDPNDYQGRKHWAELLKIGQDEPILTGKLAVKSLESMLTTTGYRWGTSSQGGIEIRRLDQWAGQFLEQLAQSSQAIDLTNQVIISDHLFRSDLRKQMIEPASNNNNFSYYLRSTVGRSLQPASPPKGGPGQLLQNTFLAWSKKLTPLQQSTFVALFLPTLIEVYDIEAKDVAPITQWADGDLRKTAPLMADALIVLVQARGAFEKPKDEQQPTRDRAAKAFVALLPQLDLPTPLALEFAHRMTNQRQSSFLFAGLPQWRWLGSKMKSHANGIRNIALSSSLQIFKVLVAQEFPEKKEAAAFLMKEIDGTLVTLELLLKYRNQNQEGAGAWVGNLLPLALAAGNQELARRLVQQNNRSFRGRLAMILRAAEDLDLSTAARLVPATTLRYDLADAPPFTKESPALVATIVEALPERDRYRFEVMTAGLADTSVEEKRPEILRPERLRTLAARFAAEAPQDNSPKWQLLDVFRSDPGSSEILIGEFEKVAKEMSLTTALALQEESDRREDGQALFEIIKVWLESEVKAGRHGVMLTEIAKVVEKADDNYNFRNRASNLALDLARLLLLEALETPGKASPLVEISRENFEQVREISRRGYGNDMGPLIWADYLTHLLAGETGAWYDRINKLDENEKTVYREQLGSASFWGLQQLFRTDRYQRDKNTRLRKTLLSAVLRDPLFLENVVTHYTIIESLLNAGLATRDELYQVFDELPGDHPRLAEFHLARAILLGYSKEKMAEAEKFYAKARELALARNDQPVVHLSDALYARLLGRKNRKSEAWIVGKKVDPEQLPELDQKWFAKESPQWKQAFQKSSTETEQKPDLPPAKSDKGQPEPSLPQNEKPKDPKISHCRPEAA